ncbi:MAG: dihydrolipoyllysine-residue acetyltransferase [Gammaproteobacteria bacterium]|nr:dihydrolipoyllysine-residue acetyltransferase [Gammaproteobacteria bacterium]
MATKNITVPDIGGATDVDVIEVLVKPGDTVGVDTPLITLESDKATMEVPSSDAGVVKEIKVKAGDKVSHGSVILTLEAASNEAAPSKKEEPKAAAKPETAAVSAPLSAAKTAAPTPAALQATPPAIKVLQSELAEVHAGPAVRRIAREFGIELADVPATGPKNRILKEDIQGYVKFRLSQMPAATGGAGLPSAPVVDFSKFGSVESVAMSRIKKLTGKNLHRNWLLVPHVTQFGEADITDLEDFRAAQKAAMEKDGVKLTPLVFIMKAVVASLKAYPQFNASLDPSGESLILKKYYHIGVAVDTPDGLVVPVIRDVDQKGLQELAKELSVVSDKARKGQLSLSDMQGGCFSISSLGGIGGTAFTPIVNVPEVAILGVSKASQKAVYEGGNFVPRLMLPLSLSYDHRVIDGADGARFMVSLSNKLSDIRNLLM